MKAEIICIGTELLLGEIVDTNASYLSQVLAELGIDLYYKSTVGDNLERAIATLKQAWKRSDLLLISGGLGPTQDDLTREAIAGLLGEEQVLNKAAMAEVAAWFKRSGREMPENNCRQAMFPPSAQPISNRWGTAPGVWVEKDGKMLAAMPGVPLELHKLMEEEVIPRLKKHLGADHPILVSRTLRAAGIGESALEEQIEDIINAQSDVTIAPYAKRGEVHLRLAVKATTEEEGLARIAPVESVVRERLDRHIFGCNEETLEEVAGRLLTARGLTLATAESCSGGLIAHRITEVPGSSEYFMGGVVSYSNEAKEHILGVDAAILEAHGAVSPETAAAMAEGARERFSVDIAIASTGIAGPGGGSEEKPVGLVYIALATPEGTQVTKNLFRWDRSQNKVATAQTGLTMLWQYLAGKSGN